MASNQSIPLLIILLCGVWIVILYYQLHKKNTSKETEEEMLLRKEWEDQKDGYNKQLKQVKNKK